MPPIRLPIRMNQGLPPQVGGLFDSCPALEQSRAVDRKYLLVKQALANRARVVAGPVADSQVHPGMLEIDQLSRRMQQYIELWMLFAQAM